MGTQRRPDKGKPGCGLMLKGRRKIWIYHGASDTHLGLHDSHDSIQHHGSRGQARSIPEFLKALGKAVGGQEEQGTRQMTG
jgi:hypothetical protein